MPDANQKLLAALAEMCAQYLEERGVLDHQCMSAGEKAIARLVEHGLVAPSGRGGVWTDAGQDLLRSA